MAFLLLCALLHDEKVVTADVRFDGSRVVVRLHVGMERIAKGVKLPVEPIELTELQLERAKAEVAAYLVSRMTVEVQSFRHDPVLEALEPRFEKFLATGEEYIASVVATFSVPSRHKVGSIGFAYDAFAEYPGSKVLVTVTWGEASRTWVRMGPDLLTVRGSDLNPTVWQTAGEFLVW